MQIIYIWKLQSFWFVKFYGGFYRSEGICFNQNNNNVYIIMFLTSSHGSCSPYASSSLNYPPLRDKTHISFGFPSEPHLYLNSVSLSEVSVWILGAPCFHNLSWMFVFLSTTWKCSVYWFKRCRSCEFS